MVSGGARLMGDCPPFSLRLSGEFFSFPAEIMNAQRSSARAVAVFSRLSVNLTTSV